MKFDQKLIAGYHPAVYARQGLMHGPIFASITDAEPGARM
jgi:hypothetical protein